LCELLVETKDLVELEIMMELKKQMEEEVVEEERSKSILLFLFIKFGLPNLHSILEPLAILYIRDAILLRPYKDDI
jgi:hypothetical protein